MEASPHQQQQQGPPSAEPDALKASSEAQPSAEIPSRHDVGRPIGPQDHHKVPSVEKTVMDVPPHTSPSPIQDHHKEPKIASEEPHHHKPVADMNSMNISPPHHDSTLSALQEHQKEASSKNSLTGTSSANDVPKPSAQEGHQKEPFSRKGVIDQHKQEHHNEPSTNTTSSKQHQVGSPTESFEKGSLAASHLTDSIEKGSLATSHRTEPLLEGQLVVASQQTSASAVLFQHQASHTTDSVQPQNKTDQEVKLTSMQEEFNPIIEQQLIKHATLPLEQHHSATSMEQSFNVSLQHPTDISTHSSSELHQVELRRDHLTIGLTVKQGDVEPLAEQHHDTAKKPEAFSALFHKDAESEQQVEVTRQTLIISSLSEAHGNVTGPVAEKLIAKESESLTMRSSQKSTRAEIDTAAPFESVKAAVSLFGERMDWKPQTRPPQTQAPNMERRVLPESELQKIQEDLMQYKDKLALTQASTAGVLLELKKVKRLILNPASKLGGTETSLEAADTLKSTEAAATDKSNNNELMHILREVESVKEELISVTNSKEAAVKGLQDALSSLNTSLKRVDELAVEKRGLDDAVADAHIALADAEEHVALLKSGHKVDSLNSMPRDFMEKKSAEIRGLESKLEEAKAMIMNLKEELLVSKKAESLSVAAASETEQKMVKVKLELDLAKSEERGIVGKLATVLEESDELKAKLEKVAQENTTLSSTIQALKSDIERGHKELESMHEKEQIACATLASLQDELQRLKEALRAAQGGEARALEAKDTLPAAIKQAALEADQAKAAAEASKEEARRARQEIEQVKAATSTAISRQQAAMKELEAAKASEAMALAEVKALTESESQSADMESESEGLNGVTISLGEYSALKQAAVEAEGLADKKVAEVIAQVEEAKASQEKAQLNLDEAAKEAENGREEFNKAQKQADDALEAKLTAEGDLRKWRAEHDQRRKSGGAPLDTRAGAIKNPPRKISEHEKLANFGPHEKEDVVVPPMVQGKKTAGRDSLAQVMNLEVPTSERLERLLTVEDSTKDKGKVKKRNLIRRLTSIVALKKKP